MTSPENSAASGRSSVVEWHFDIDCCVSNAPGGGSLGVTSPTCSDLEDCGFDPDDFLNLSEECVEDRDRDNFLTSPEDSASVGGGNLGAVPAVSDLEGYEYDPIDFATLEELDGGEGPQHLAHVLLPKSIATWSLAGTALLLTVAAEEETPLVVESSKGKPTEAIRGGCVRALFTLFSPPQHPAILTLQPSLPLLLPPLRRHALLLAIARWPRRGLNRFIISTEPWTAEKISNGRAFARLPPRSGSRHASSCSTRRRGSPRAAATGANLRGGSQPPHPFSPGRIAAFGRFPAQQTVPASNDGRNRVDVTMEVSGGSPATSALAKAAMEVTGSELEGLWM
ncbi:hypothetical protein NL676_030341 [Syzygium grande]|nr:hypothetical protein NL676_030341 [Syzygium grande]